MAYDGQTSATVDHHLIQGLSPNASQHLALSDLPSPSSRSSPTSSAAVRRTTVIPRKPLPQIAAPSYTTFISPTSRIPIAQRGHQAAPAPRHFSYPVRSSSVRTTHGDTVRPQSLDGPLKTPTKAKRDDTHQRSASTAYERHPRGRHSSHLSRASIASSMNSTGSSSTSNNLKPHIALELNGVQRTLSTESLSSTSDQRPKSPSRLGTLFGWGAKSNKTGTDSPTTPFSEQSLSPQPSPRKSSMVEERSLPPAPVAADGAMSHVQELERELSHISAELAGSIRREMDLEDEIERLKMEIPSVPPSEMSRRGSDYFSDSGAGSVRYPISDPDAKIEEVERLRRKAEQDKAQMKLDIAQKLQTELAQRRSLEEHIHSLEHQMDLKSQQDIVATNKRVEELESQLEATRRRLSEEKEAKENFEDLYTALQSEFTSGRRGMGSIAEEDGIQRSGSQARKTGLARTGSMKGEGRGRSGSLSAPVTAEGMKEVEDQRDALQKSLRLLVSRYDKQRRDHERHLKKLSRPASRSEARPGYQREVSGLKEEVTTLRKRTEDALEQKWQYEKSLSGIKMDLDRAEQETRGLRTLLKEHDIMAPSPRTMQSATFGSDGALSDRDQAKRLAKDFRSRANQMQQSGSSARELAQLQQAAARMEQLSQQFDEQARTNGELRERLAAAVAKGEREQSQSTRQIEEMQKRLAGMEDSVLAAQQHSETTLSTHETEVRAIEEAASPRLQRLEIPELGKLSPLSPGLMRSKSAGARKRVKDVSLLDVSRASMLERKVRELERLLRDAEDDMEYVVQRVNKSQFEVAELTNERDAAFTQMRKLQDRLVEETEKAEMFMIPARFDGGNDSGSDYGD